MSTAVRIWSSQLAIVIPHSVSINSHEPNKRPGEKDDFPLPVPLLSASIHLHILALQVMSQRSNIVVVGEFAIVIWCFLF